MSNSLKIVTLNICNVSPGGNLKYGFIIYLFASIILTIFFFNYSDIKWDFFYDCISISRVTFYKCSLGLKFGPNFEPFNS